MNLYRLIVPPAHEQPTEREVDQLVDSGEKRQNHCTAAGKTKAHGKSRHSPLVLPRESEKKGGTKKSRRPFTGERMTFPTNEVSGDDVIGGISFTQNRKKRWVILSGGGRTATWRNP